VKIRKKMMEKEDERGGELRKIKKREWRGIIKQGGLVGKKNGWRARMKEGETCERNKKEGWRERMKDGETFGKKKKTLEAAEQKEAMVPIKKQVPLAVILQKTQLLFTYETSHMPPQITSSLYYQKNNIYNIPTS
jgi:hypothetical protein